MTIAMTAEIEDLVGALLKSGNYQSAEDVILKGLQLLEAQERKFVSTRRDLQAGLDDLREGRFITIDSEAEMEAFKEDVIRRGRERIKQKEQLFYV